MHLWGLASPKPSGQASKLEIQRRADIAAEVQRQAVDRIPSSSGKVSLFIKVFN